MILLIGLINMNTPAINNTVRNETIPNDVENTVSGFSSSLLAKRKKVSSFALPKDTQPKYAI